MLTRKTTPYAPLRTPCNTECNIDSDDAGQSSAFAQVRVTFADVVQWQNISFPS